MKDKDKINELVEMRQQMAAPKTPSEHQQTVEALRQCTAELKARYQELDTFAYTLSHNLRGTLGLMISFAQVLKEYHSVLTGEELCRYLDTIAQKGHRMLKVIDELLEIETAPPPDKDVDIGPLDMDSVVTDTLDLLDYLIDEHRAEISLPESWPMALGYAPWVEEVWFNYLNNAIQYGGQPPRIELGFSIADSLPGESQSTLPSALPQKGGPGIPNSQSEMVRFWVRDNGDGLTPKEQARLFQPFARPDQVPTTGYGLGLILVRRIVEKLGGQFGVESEGLPGRGSTFFFTLPSTM